MPYSSYSTRHKSFNSINHCLSDQIWFPLLLWASCICQFFLAKYSPGLRTTPMFLKCVLKKVRRQCRTSILSWFSAKLDPDYGRADVVALLALGIHAVTCVIICAFSISITQFTAVIVSDAKSD